MKTTSGTKDLAFYNERSNMLSDPRMKERVGKAKRVLGEIKIILIYRSSI